jgi:hypothetical protein
MSQRSRIEQKSRGVEHAWEALYMSGVKNIDREQLK